MVADFGEILESSFLPALTKNLDDFPISDEVFAEYKQEQILNTQILFDAIQQYKNSENNFLDNKTKCTLIVLFCERLANFKTTYYKDSNTEHSKFMKATAFELVKNLDKDTLGKILSYYTGRLNADSWKTEVGALNGFVTFLQNFLDENKFKDQWIHFPLSIGLKLVQIHEDDWKSLGLSILNLILTKGDKLQVKDFNIHNLVYEEVSKIVLSSTCENLTYEANQTLLYFLEFVEITDEWSRRDDIIELNIQKLKLSSSAEFCSHILDLICKVVSKDQMKLLDEDYLIADSLDELCASCQKNVNTLALRWSKTVLETLSNISLFLNTMDSSKASKLLVSFIKTYLIFVYLVPKVVLQYQMEIVEKILKTVFEATSIHEGTAYLDVFKTFLTVIRNHLQSSDHVFQEADSLSKEVESYIEKVDLLKHIK